MGLILVIIAACAIVAIIGYELVTYLLFRYFG